MNPIIIFIISAFFSLSSFAQCQVLSDAELIELFLEISETDQSHLEEPEVRHRIFEKNFDTIIQVFECQGYPQLKTKPKRKKHRYAIDNAMNATIFHIMQSSPDKMLNDSVVALFKKEIDHPRFKYLLDYSLKYFLLPNKSNQLTEMQYEKYLHAIKEWELDSCFADVYNAMLNTDNQAWKKLAPSFADCGMARSDLR